MSKRLFALYTAWWLDCIGVPYANYFYLGLLLTS